MAIDATGVAGVDVSNFQAVNPTRCCFWQPQQNPLPGVQPSRVRQMLAMDTEQFMQCPHACMVFSCPNSREPGKRLLICP